MANSLGVTRAAVWKAIESLRSDGYVIESVAAKGYRLVEAPDILGERELLMGLKTKVLGRRVICLDEVDSTNTYAARLAADGEPEGTAVIADAQTAGRGRLGRTWVSPPAMNLYMSLILRPRIPPTDAPMTTLAAGVALARAVIGLYGLPAAIKWPNDLHINGKKAAGILTEMSAEPQTVRHIILGIGVDVNMPAKAFPAEIRDISTSVMLESGEKKPRAELFRRMLEELEAAYELLVRGEKARLLGDWRRLSSTLGRKVRISGLDRDKIGVARDIDESGNILLEGADGRTETITAGDVFYL